jgi:hypothetical protein
MAAFVGFSYERKKKMIPVRETGKKNCRSVNESGRQLFSHFNANIK